MVWSYQDTMPTDKDKVRFYCGDVDSSEQLVTDEEILFALSEEGTVRLAAATICERIGARFTRLSDITEGDLSLKYSQRYSQFLELASSLRSRSAVTASPLAGGISVSDKNQQNADTDRVKPAFTVDDFDSPETTGPQPWADEL
jgi:hypothetical protein